MGAGPADSTAAAEAVARNINVMIIEEHKKPGDPPHCTGIQFHLKLTKHNLTQMFEKDIP